jgi:hypothetical protein
MVMVKLGFVLAAGVFCAAIFLAALMARRGD